MDKNINMIIMNSLTTFDKQNKKYKLFIKDENINIDRDNLKIKFNKLNKEFTYQTLGVFDKNSNVWLWGWMYPEFSSDEIILVKNLLNYGLKQNNDNKEKQIFSDTSFLKTQLTNSRFLIKKKFQLDTHLAICSYLLKDKIKFIYQQPLLKNRNISLYLLIN